MARRRARSRKGRRDTPRFWRDGSIRRGAVCCRPDGTRGGGKDVDAQSASGEDEEWVVSAPCGGGDGMEGGLRGALEGRGYEEV